MDRTNALMLIGLLNDLGLWFGKLSCLNQRINLFKLLYLKISVHVMSYKL